MTTRRQQRYDHRLRELIQRTGDVTIATDLGVPRSTACGWLRTAPTPVVSLDVTDVTELELRHEVLKLRRQMQKLAALLRLTLTLLRVSGFTFSGERLPDGEVKMQILHAIIRRVSASRYAHSYGSSVSRQAASMPGVGDTRLASSMTSRLVPAHRRID